MAGAVIFQAYRYWVAAVVGTSPQLLFSVGRADHVEEPASRRDRDSREGCRRGFCQ